MQTFALYTSVCCSSARIPLGFAHPVIELIWAVRRRCQERHNNWFNYSGILGYEPLLACEIDFNSTARQAKREAAYFRLVQPYQFHTLIPESCIYCYSFALYPEEAQPSGSANFSRLESVTIILDLQDGLQHEDVTGYYLFTVSELAEVPRRRVRLGVLQLRWTQTRGGPPTSHIKMYMSFTFFNQKKCLYIRLLERFFVACAREFVRAWLWRTT